jgi:hypothetical protein
MSRFWDLGTHESLQDGFFFHSVAASSLRWKKDFVGPWQQLRNYSIHCFR